MRIASASTCLALLCFLSATDAKAAEQDARREAFAFANASGTRLLALSGLSDPGRPYRAVCPGGKVFRVKYVQRKAATSKDTGRDTAANFDNHGGDLFQFVGGRTRPDSTCFLMEEASLKQKTVVTSTPLGNKKCDPAQSKKVADEKGRAVAQCWRKLALGSGKELVLVRFEGRGKSALASLVLLAPTGFAFMDFPGQDDATSTWRVDDGGILEPQDFAILFIMNEGGTMEFGLSWAGAEGAALQLLRLEGKSFRPILEEYRYWVPS